MRINWVKIVSNIVIIAFLIIISAFCPLTFKYHEGLAQALLIMAIALVAFCGIFLGQIKFTTRPSIINKIPNINRITRGLAETIIIGFVVIIFIILYFIIGSDNWLTLITLSVVHLYAYFIGGANATRLFRR